MNDIRLDYCSIFFTFQFVLNNSRWDIFSMWYLVLSSARFRLQCLNKLKTRILDPAKSVMELFSQCNLAVKWFSLKSIINVVSQGLKADQNIRLSFIQFLLKISQKAIISVPPDTHTYVCVSGCKKCWFFPKNFRTSLMIAEDMLFTQHFEAFF